MLDKLRDRALRAIEATSTCTLSTTGPAGLQASAVSCRVQETRIFVSIPVTSDHLFNLEHCVEVVLTTARWQIRGRMVTEGDVQALVTGVGDAPAITVEVTPVRMHLEPTGSGHRETIDFE